MTQDFPMFFSNLDLLVVCREVFNENSIFICYFELAYLSAVFLYFYEYLLNACYVPDIVEGTWYVVVNSDNTGS